MADDENFRENATPQVSNAIPPEPDPGGKDTKPLQPSTNGEANSSSGDNDLADKKKKAPQPCLVCKKVVRCKYNIMRNGDVKHLCTDSCFATFRAKPAVYLKNNNKEPPAPPAVKEKAPAAAPSPEPTGRRSRPTQAACNVCGKVAAVHKELTTAEGEKVKLCSEGCVKNYHLLDDIVHRPPEEVTSSPRTATCNHCGAKVADPTTMLHEGENRFFCNDACMTRYKKRHAKQKTCAWCAASKVNFDMVERVTEDGQTLEFFCDLNCLSLHRVNLQAASSNHVRCDNCKRMAPAQFHLTMSDASVRNFCSYQCVEGFQAQYAVPQQQQAIQQQQAMQQQRQQQQHPRAQQQQQLQTRGKGRGRPSPAVMPPPPAPASARPTRAAQKQKGRAPSNPVPERRPSPAPRTTNHAPVHTQMPVVSANVGTGVESSQLMVKPPEPVKQLNKTCQALPTTQTKATSCRPHTCTRETQTELEYVGKPFLVPVPVPMYIPAPMAMYQRPMPVPLPIPVPVPVPYFIPTTKKNADSILKHIKEITERMPSDPLEAEILMMAEAAAKAGNSDTSDSSDEEPPANEEDMLAHALRMASEMDMMNTNPHMDLESQIAPTPLNPAVETQFQALVPEPTQQMYDDGRLKAGRKRRGGGSVSRQQKQTTKRIKREVTPAPEQQVSPQPEPQGPPADLNSFLKFTYGVNAWKHWVMQKNAEIEKSGNKRQRQFKVDLRQCTADELNYSLCLFIKEVRKPNGEEYAPDSIYYLCLGIQQYLFENKRMDNIFTDYYYETFTDLLNEVLHRYEVRLNAQGLIVCRIEEEHLWESRLLGAYSPQVLLNTLIYYNTKYFMLKTPEDHLRLSFSNIMKHWKKTNIPGSKAGGRAVYLRYYPPGDNKNKKREDLPAFDQTENVENPLRCPVKLYEFYLEKIPESIKNRNDTFYLVPERSCVPESPVWYSTTSLGAETMTKMLNRLRLVREIQEAHLHTQHPYMG